MKQLSGLDASFLYVETGSQFGHVSSLSIYAKPEDDADYDPFAAWRAQIERRLHFLEPLRRRLREVPLGLDHPYWIDDPDFDLDFHVRHSGVPPPGRDDQIAEIVARIVGRPLDRSRPLWETYVLEGLPDDRFGILTKVHHATIDGAAGAELLTLMLDGDASGDVLPPTATVEEPTERVPSDGEMLARAATSLVRKPGRALLLGVRTMRELGTAVRNPIMVTAANQVRAGLHGPLGAVLNIGRPRVPEGEITGPVPTKAPRLRFNAAITPHRRFAFRSTSLRAVKEVKNALGATVNDVVMAMCAGGLRRWLDDHDELPELPLVAMVPVSIRSGEEAEKWTNRVSAMFATLPTDEPDPLLRVGRVHEAMVDAKGLFDAVPAEALTDFAQFPPPAVFARAMRTAVRLTARHFMPPVNVTISNVPGPRQPLYTAGAQMLHYYPVSTILDGQGLNITVQSYLDTLDFGLVSCRELVPDLWDLADAVVDDLGELAKATGVDLAGSPSH
jgi:diacylglycerol O-acyltransferase / wax synthase